MTASDLYARRPYEEAAQTPRYGAEKAPGGGPTGCESVGVGAVLRGRQESLERLVRGLENLLEERERLRDDVLAAIDRDETTVADLILAMYRPGVVGTDNPAYVKLRVEQLRLERERRQATVECWRDSALLAKDLVEKAERAREAARIGELLGERSP